MMEFIDRTKITEETARVLVHQKPKRKYVCTLHCRDVKSIWPGSLPCAFYSDSEHIDYPKDPTLKVFNCEFGHGAVFAKEEKPHLAPIICAESIQAEQRGERFSLRGMK